MDIDNIMKEIKKIGISDEIVHIGKTPNYGERINLIKRQDGKLEVFYGVHGCKSDLHVYESEETAVNAFLERLRKQDSRHAMDCFSFLPIGSVVRCKGGTVDVIIIARAVLAKGKNGEPVYYDYGALLYPYGLVNGNMAYFQKEDIEEVLFVGYINDREEKVVQYLHQFEEAKKDVPRGNKDSLPKMVNSNEIHG